MIAFAWFSLAACVICMALGTLVFSFNRKPILNKLFFLSILTGFFYSFTTVMMWLSDNPSSALLWHKAGTMWPFFVAIVLHFAIVFTHNDWLKFKLHYIALYLPAVSYLAHRLKH